MPTFGYTGVSHARKLLADTVATSENVFNKLNNQSDIEDSDAEYDYSTPPFYLFYDDGGSAAIVSMTNFNPLEFTQI